MSATIHPFPAPTHVWPGCNPPIESGFVITRDGVVAATYGRSWDHEWSWHHDDRSGETPDGAVLAVADDEDAAWAWMQSWLASQGYSDVEAAEEVEQARRGDANPVVRGMFRRSLEVL